MSLCRYRIDLRDFVLHRCPEAAAAQRRTVCVGKHLCGGATDLSLRCVLNAITVSGSSNAAPVTTTSSAASAATTTTTTTTTATLDVAGIQIATCCHARCDWSSYIDCDYLVRLGLIDAGASDEAAAYAFDVICKLTAWHATCGDGTADPCIPTKLNAESGASSADSKGAIKSAASGADSKQRSAKGKPASEHATSDSDEEDGHAAAVLSGAEKERLGLRLKLLLDFGRVLFLRRHGICSRRCVAVPCSGL